MVKNTLGAAKAPTATASTSIVEYQSNGELVKISPDMIKKYLVSGNGTVNDQEVMMFLSLCRYQHLNPFLREAYLIKYGSNSPATMVVGKDLFEKRAARNPRYQGKECGILVVNLGGEIEEREGTFYMDGEQLVGGWARIFVEGRDKPEYESVSLREYAGRKADGSLNGQWAKMPATMIKKVAVAHALRAAFPEEFGALYAPEEIPEATAQPLPDAPVVPVEAPVEVEVVESTPEPVKAPKKAKKSAEEAMLDSLEDEIFGGN